MRNTKIYTLLALLLLAGWVKMQAQNRELPTDYWKDVVTQQPTGYVVDAYDNVHLYSAEALAWLISTVNGFNGQETDDFNGKKVTLEANVEMSGAIWTPIADGKGLGDLNPDRLKFCGTFDGNGFVVNGLILLVNPNLDHFESFFGNLCGARIENVVLRHVYSEGDNISDGKFFGSADPLELPDETRPNIIDRCFIEIDELHKNGMNTASALFGFRNDGVIRNCMVKCGNLSYPEDWYECEGLFVWYNYGVIQNCASVVDSLKWLFWGGGLADTNYGVIENSYSFIADWYGDFPYWMPPTPRTGVAVNNYGTIKHCYYNTFKYHDTWGGDWFDEEPVFYNEGTIENTVPFEPMPYFQSPYWIFAEPVSIISHTGFVYETTELNEALNDWILGNEYSDDYEYWCASPICSIFSNYLPSFSGMDITNVDENLTYESNCVIYPNPAKDFVKIEGTEAAEVRVYNALGQMVKTVRGTNEVDLSGLVDGVYLLRITDADGKNHVARVAVKE